MKMRSFVLGTLALVATTMGTSHARDISILEALLLPATAITAGIQTGQVQYTTTGVLVGATYSVPYLNVTSTTAAWTLMQLSQIRKVRVAEQLVDEIENFQFTGEASQLLSETLSLNNISEEEKDSFLTDLHQELNQFLESSK